MPSVFIKTYGCQMNERDSEAVAAQLVDKGYSMTADALTADVILLNTCSVRDAAEQKALGKMSHVAGQLRSKNRKAVLGFMGCMAQSRGRELIDKLPDVDLVVGTQKFHRTADHIGDLPRVGNLIGPNDGFGLTFRVIREPGRSGALGSAGEYSWGGAAGTRFWIDPKEELIGLFMVQILPHTGLQFGTEFKNLVYQSIVD